MGTLKINANSQSYLDLPKAYNGIIYGPFESTPFGKNIGINLMGESAKLCSFNCPYCDLGHSQVRLNKAKDQSFIPSKEEVMTAIAEAFKKIHELGPQIDGITVSGNGEPTLHPDFSDIMKSLLESRNQWTPGKPIHLFTNGAGVDSRKISDALNLLDERIVKIDVGNEKLFKLVNAPLSRANLAKVLTGIRKMNHVIVQSLFFDGSVSNVQKSDIDDWLEVIAMIRPKAVHIYGMSRTPATPGLVRCEEDTLYSIASRLERKTQIRALVFP